jgi:lipopolysaccharide export system permease protein
MPAAMLLRHAEVLTNFFICFLPILAIYYPLLMLSQDLATSGKWPPIIFWMGNVILFGSAALLLRRIIRH